jgi:2-phosphosulfolactate phosphatase
MKIDVAFSATHVDELQLRDKNVLVIDVLRSSTTVITALANGAREIIPVASVESAVKISGSLFGDVMLRGGERNGRMIQGFNLGNSPLEYTEATVKGKSIIFCTTNGAVAMTKCRYARMMGVTGFVNISKSVELLQGVEGDALLLCSGRTGATSGFSIEDTVCAGMMIDMLLEADAAAVELADSSLAALSLYKRYARSIPKLLRECDHGKYLAEIGFEEDLALCSKVDTIPVVPTLQGTSVRLKRDDRQTQETEEPAQNVSS